MRSNSCGGGISMFMRIGFLVLALGIAFPACADPVAPAPAPAPADTAAAPAAAAPADTAAPTVAPAASTPPASADGTVPSSTAPGAPPSTDSLSAAPLHTEDYIAPTWSDLMFTMVRFGALDLKDNNLIDEFAAVTDCDIYQYYYKDDFKWNEIRKKIRDSADIKMTEYPSHYYYFTALRLDRYDFEKKLYRFTDSTAVENVNLFTLVSSFPTACGQKIHYIPTIFQAVADTPFSMAGLPLAPAEAQSLLRQMNADKNKDRAIVVRFNLTVNYINRLRKGAVGAESNNMAVKYSQTFDKHIAPNTLRVDVHLDSVSFYEDVDMKKLIYTTKP